MVVWNRKLDLQIVSWPSGSPGCCSDRFAVTIMAIVVVNGSHIHVGD